MTELVHLERSGRVATVTLDSPENRNALSRQLVGELTAHLEVVDADPGIRLVVLTHTGGTFCAGADLLEAVRDGMEAGTRALLGLLRAVVGLGTPVVAKVDGHVRAGGVGLVGACDLAYVTPASTFAFTEVRLGLAPAIISLTTRHLLSSRDASGLYLSGETFDGNRAAELGLVSRCVDADQLSAEIERLGAEFGALSPQGLRQTRRLLNDSVLADMDARGEDLVELSARLFASDEAREGMTAFRERRKPRWAE